jgi:putative SOS response-associated peptidase YedK
VCGRFLVLTSSDELVAHFCLAERFQPRSRYNVAPSQEVLTVGPSREGRPATASFRWGLVPSWAAEPKPGPINARSETVATRETFAEAFRRRRCLVPASGFYEWEQLLGREKTPWAFRLRDSGPFAFAGLWQAWRPPAGRPSSPAPS